LKEIKQNKMHFCLIILSSCYQGDLNDHESLVKTMKAVDVVISAIGVQQIKEQTKLIAAIKEAGTIKVGFLPLSPQMIQSNGN
jgi:putative NADH-flavin reductase